MKAFFNVTILLILMISGCHQPKKAVNDLWNYAISRKSDLQLSAFFTTYTLKQAMATESGKRGTVSLLRCNGIINGYPEVYRSGFLICQGWLSDIKNLLGEPSHLFGATSRYKII